MEEKGLKVMGAPGLLHWGSHGRWGCVVADMQVVACWECWM